MSSQLNEAGASSTPALPAQTLISCGDISCEFLVNPIPRPKPAPFKVTIKPEKQRPSGPFSSKTGISFAATRPRSFRPQLRQA